MIVAPPTAVIFHSYLKVHDFKMHARMFSSQAQADIYRMKLRVDALEKSFAARYKRVLLENDDDQD